MAACFFLKTMEGESRCIQCDRREPFLHADRHKECDSKPAPAIQQKA